MAVEKTKDKTNLEIDTNNTEIVIDPKKSKKVVVNKNDHRVKVKERELAKKETKKMKPLTKLLIAIGCGLAAIALGIGLGFAVVNIPTVDRVSTKYFAALSSGDINQINKMIDSASTTKDTIVPPADTVASLKGVFGNVTVQSTNYNGDTVEVTCKVDIKDMGENNFIITLKKTGTYLLFFPDWKVENMAGSSE
ncbi:MAG: hypothetical protein LBB10_02360 [Bifidobacteriaceae bacterium]|jgi:hypothetical protein|nr:hypothetical protein [Bifidobacteriaceae bacterium]